MEVGGERIVMYGVWRQVGEEGKDGVKGKRWRNDGGMGLEDMWEKGLDRRGSKEDINKMLRR